MWKSLQLMYVRLLHATSNLVSTMKEVLDEKTVCDEWAEMIEAKSVLVQQDIGWTSIRRFRKERSFMKIDSLRNSWQIIFLLVLMK